MRLRIKARPGDGPTPPVHNATPTGLSPRNDPAVALTLLIAAIAALLLASLPAIQWCVNLPRFRDLAPQPGVAPPPVSVLIPARNEAGGIEASVDAVLASDGVTLEVVVLDDGSTDGTGDLVRQINQRDGRVRLIDGVGLPDGWNGKQHACFRLSQAAAYDHFLFLDADVRMQPAALSVLLRRKARPLPGGPIALLSCFPRQQTGTVAEKLLIPMMHYLLLGYLPFGRMRATPQPGFASGCGQMFLTDRASYHAAGTHRALAGSRHDGLKLPLAYRQAGLMTDCVDGTELAVCRMYTTTAEVRSGLLKNATEGIANTRLIVPFSVLLLGGSVLPWLVLAAALIWQEQLPEAYWGATTCLAMIAVGLSLLPRLLAVWRLRQSWIAVPLHPVAVMWFLALQVRAMINAARGKQVAWRGRV